MYKLNYASVSYGSNNIISLDRTQFPQMINSIEDLDHHKMAQKICHLVGGHYPHDLNIKIREEVNAHHDGKVIFIPEAIVMHGFKYGVLLTWEKCSG